MGSPYKDPAAVYDAVWKEVRDHFFDRSKLAAWRQWRHRFDHLITSQDEALAYAADMLKSLEDDFTCLYYSKARSHIQKFLRQSSIVSTKVFGDVGHVRIDNFMANDTDRQMQQALSRFDQCHSIVIDLRANFGGQNEVAFRCAELLMPTGSLGSTKKRVSRFEQQTLSYELTAANQIITTRSSIPWRRTLRQSKRRHWQDVVADRTVVLLIDADTGSAAEWLALILKERGTIVIGEQSLGKGLGQSHIPLNGLGFLQMTTSRFYSPNGHWLGDGQKQCYGITPDIIQKARCPQERFGHYPELDSQLQAAFRHLRAH